MIVKCGICGEMIDVQGVLSDGMDVLTVGKQVFTRSLQGLIFRMQNRYRTSCHKNRNLK
jgi:hypothetical protein